MQDFFAAASGILDGMVADRRHLHRNPEVGRDLPETVRFVMSRLRDVGLDPREAGPGGVVASVGRRGGRVFLLRADMDALPMREESGLPFASVTDAAHTCGHDLHTAMLLGAARLLKTCEEELQGEVRLVFQPDEEGLTGAAAMIDAGVLDDPPVDAAMGLHVLAGDAAVGSFGITSGAVMASSDRFRITVSGTGGHGAMPHLAVDPIQAGVHIHLGLQGIVARENDTQNPLVITVGSFQAGTAANVIPETAVLLGTVRALDPAVRAFGCRRVEEVAQAGAAVFRTRCRVEWMSGTPPVVNNPELVREASGWIAPFARSIAPMPPMMGSEDFALYAGKVPGVYLFLGAGEVREGEYGRGALAHHPRVRFSEDALPYGAAAMAACAAGWLEAHGG